MEGVAAAGAAVAAEAGAGVACSSRRAPDAANGFGFRSGQRTSSALAASSCAFAENPRPGGIFSLFLFVVDVDVVSVIVVNRVFIEPPRQTGHTHTRTYIHKSVSICWLQFTIAESGSFCFAAAAKDFGHVCLGCNRDPLLHRPIPHRAHFVRLSPQWGDQIERAEIKAS